jgi:toxin ParE1/3/4
MILEIRQSDFFWADMLKQLDWYRDNAGADVASRYVDAVQITVEKLAAQPDLGRLRFGNFAELKGIRSVRVQPPYHRHLLFYRFDRKTLFAERVIHGARDLPRRLIQSPYNG